MLIKFWSNFIDIVLLNALFSSNFMVFCGNVGSMGMGILDRLFQWDGGWHWLQPLV